MKAVEGWTSVTVLQCCEILDSKRVPVNAEDRDRRVGDIPYYGANGVQGYIDDYIFDEPLILIAEDGGCFDEFATRPIAYRVNGKSWVNNHAHVLRAKEGFCQDTIFYALEHKDIQSFIVGGTRSKLNQSALRSIEIDLPTSKPEQTKIAEILSTVDRAIEQTEALIAKQQRIKSGLMQDLLTRGIDEHGNLRTEQTHKFKESPLGRIPVEWEVAELSTITPSADSITYGVLKPGPFVEGGVPLLQIEDVIHGEIGVNSLHRISPELDAQYKRTRLYGGELVVSLVGTIGRVAHIPHHLQGANLHRNLGLIRVIEPNSSRFILHYLQCEMGQKEFLDNTLGSTQSLLNLSNLRSLRIIKPTPPEQTMIAELCDSINSTMTTNELSLRKLRSLKTALMQDLLAGKKRITALLNDAEDEML